MKWVEYKKALIKHIEILEWEMIDSIIQQEELRNSWIQSVKESSILSDIADIIESHLPLLCDCLSEDAQYMFDTDPAAHSVEEVLLCYPWIKALWRYRVAHLLYDAKEYLWARILAEHVHSLTGIDIHPGAKIGHYVAIDHGTGIVIGSTAVIGNYVRIYHNVSLGNLSVKKSQEWTKRHPTIEDYVTIYAGAIILWWETTIGHHSTIWWWAVVIRSVEPHSLVTTQYTTSYYDKREREQYAKEEVSER